MAGRYSFQSEYQYEKVKEKSKEFLKDILGQELFNKFINDGKIEIESGDNVYELHESGRVINRNTNQAYCIVPDRPDYPDYDIIAIKFAWLKHGLSTVERVANKTSLNPLGHTRNLNDREAGIGYDAFGHHMETQGWIREQLSIDESSTNLVTTNDINVGDTRNVIDIRCPAGRSITIMGVEQVPNGIDPATAHRVILDIRDTYGVEIPGNTKIRIVKMKPSQQIVQLVREFYSIFSLNRAITTEIGTIRVYKADNELYRWRRGVMLNEEELLRIEIINSEVKIPSGNVKFTIDMDLWARRL